MVDQFSHTRSIALPFDVARRAKFAMSGLTRWAAARELLPSPVLRALLETAYSVQLDLDAAMRLVERADRDGQPLDAAELTGWRFVQETLQEAIGFDPADVAPSLARYYGTERFVWRHRPSNLREMSHEDIVRWTRAMLPMAVGGTPVEVPPEPALPTLSPEEAALGATVFDGGLERVSDHGVR